MTKIIPYDDSPIINEEAQAKKHTTLVESLKRSLIIGQSGFIKAGQYLHEIKTSETFKYEDSTKENTWKEFISRPDIPIPGGTTESRMRIAQKLMCIYREFVESRSIDEKKLAQIGYTKLALVASALNKNKKADVNDWLEKAAELSTVDLQAEVEDGGKSLSQVQACKHANLKKTTAWKCPDCGGYWRYDPTK